MKKYILLFIITISFNNANSQARGVKIGYIDMEYILEKVPSYAEAQSQLEQKAQKWKQEIEVKKNDIKVLEDALTTEKVLLTKELIEEREAEIAFQKNELLEYQQKRFGSNGDLVLQKAVLVKPIQDQVFNAVQDIAEAKKYDIILDKSSDLTVLFASKRLDISDQVIRAIVRSERKEQLSKKQLEAEKEKDRKQDLIDEDPEAAAEKEKKAEDKKAARQKIIDDRKAAVEERKRLALEQRTGNKTGTVSDKNTNEGEATTNTNVESKEDKAAKIIEDRKKAQEERQRIIDHRKKAAEEKRLKTIADREAAKKAKEEQNKKP